MRFIVFLSVFLTVSTNAMSLNISLKTLVNTSDYTGVVEVIDIKKDEGCGYLVTAKSLKSFKGELDNLSFWVRNNNDLMNKQKKYFAILKRSQMRGICNQNLLSSGERYQTFFPIKDMGELYILANRGSFMASSDSISYYPVGYVKIIQVVDQRIYAFGKWKEIEDAILKFQ